jgi:glutamate-1-semialdehyde 2,1-aminomutase
LIFDEVKTGLTAGPHGAAVRLGVQPDLITLAKSIGGGMPVAAFGGKKHVMDAITDNRMPHFGTFNGNPLAMAGIRGVDMVATPEALAEAERLNHDALDRITDIINEFELPAHTVGFGVKGCITWSIDPVRNYRDYKATDFEVAELSWLWSLNRGIITPPGLDEQWLISLAHTHKKRSICSSKISVSWLLLYVLENQRLARVKLTQAETFAARVASWRVYPSIAATTTGMIHQALTPAL